ncbi:hypothetical protein [Streptomyces mirabilis]|uniref:hypothetical protein n=1 Tax=Streptomyces mirabilis TaxID=68239 RepID=UPI0035DB0B73
MVASRASLRARTIDPWLDLTDIADFTRVGSSPRYGRSKLMDIMFTQELGRRLQGAGVAVTCCCPGFNVTGLGCELPLAGALERAFTALGIGNPRYGADIIVKLATDPEFADSTGGYFAPGPQSPCSALRSGEAKRFSVRCGRPRPSSSMTSGGRTTPERPARPARRECSSRRMAMPRRCRHWRHCCR